MNTTRLLSLYRVAKQSRNRVTLFAQRGTKVRIRVMLLLTWHKITGSKLVFDLDDALYVRFPWSTRALCRHSDVVIVANHGLADYARQFSRRVFVVPTSIDLKVYELPGSPSPTRDIPVIGWIGTCWNLRYLSILATPLKRLKLSNKFVLTLVTDPSSVGEVGLPPQIPLRIIPWTLKDFVQNLAGFDVGVCPLPDNEWTRGKSSYKVLEYMALGIPSVASPVGGIADAIDPGTDGFFAATEDDWYERLRDLLDHPEMRREMGKAGRKKVEARFSLDAAAKAIERQLDELDQE